MIQGQVTEDTRIGLEYIQRLGNQMKDFHATLSLLEDAATAIALNSSEPDKDRLFLLAIAQERDTVGELYQQFIAMAVVATDALLKGDATNYGSDMKILDSMLNEALEALQAATGVSTRMVRGDQGGIRS